MLNQRQRAILAQLVVSGRYAPVAELAERMGVSPRAIRYDLGAIEAHLAGTPYELDRHKRLGVRCLVPEAERAAMLARLEPVASAMYRLSPEERCRAIVAALLLRNAPISLGRLADELFVSRRTLVEDLKRVELWLQARALRLHRLARGVQVQGDEVAWRHALAEVISPVAARWPVWPLDPSEMAEIRQAVVAQTRRLPCPLAEVAIEALVFHLAVVVTRLRAGHDIVMDPAQLAELEQDPAWGVAGRIARWLEQRFDLALPRSEWGYITLHLLGAKRMPVPGGEPESGSDHMLDERVAAFIRAAGAHLGVDLTGDQDLHCGILQHLRPALYRLRYGLTLVNPLQAEIEQHYGHLMDAVRAAAPTLEEPLGVRLNEHELGYLALHIGASLERRLAAVRPRLLLVCGSGIGTARLLESRVQRAFPQALIVGVVPLEALRRGAVQEEVDLIVSTLPVPPGSVPVVVVNPFLTPEDVRQIQQVVQPLGAPLLYERRRGPVLAEVLTPRQIQLDVEVADREAAIRLAGGLLVDAGAVERRYVDAMVQTVERLGPYIVIDRGVAMPHARPEDGAGAVGFSFVRLKRPIRFGHEQNDPVSLIFAVATPDGEQHLRALQELARLLSDPQTRQVFERGSVAEILDRIRSGNPVEGR